METEVELTPEEHRLCIRAVAYHGIGFHEAAGLLATVKNEYPPDLYRTCWDILKTYEGQKAYADLYPAIAMLHGVFQMNTVADLETYLPAILESLRTTGMENR